MIMKNVIKSRLKVYLNETKPLLDFYQKENKLNKCQWNANY